MSVLNVELFESLDFLSVTRYCEITQGAHQASFGQGAQNAMKTFNYRAIISSVMDTSAPCFYLWSPNCKYLQLLSFMAV